MPYDVEKMVRSDDRNRRSDALRRTGGLRALK